MKEGFGLFPDGNNPKPTEKMVGPLHEEIPLKLRRNGKAKEKREGD